MLRYSPNLEVAGSIPAPATNDIIRCVVTNKGPICAVGGLTPMRMLGNDHTTMLLAMLFANKNPIHGEVNSMRQSDYFKALMYIVV